MKRATYKAFTLIEMLIVMGILVILMVVGVAAGRFAIDRAGQIAHQNGATQIYQALQSHFTDYGEFPNGTKTIKEMVEATSNEEGNLSKYLDMGSFKGGSEADYSYFVNANKQAVVVCVTLGGYNDDTKKGISCVGNGFGAGAELKNGAAVGGTTITIEKEFYDAKEAGDETMYTTIKGATNRSKWDGKKWVSGSATE